MTDTPLSIRPSEIVWHDQPTVAKGAKFAVLLGDPAAPGKYVIRLRAPAGHRVLVHSHPEARIYTVMEGTFHLGFGHTFAHEQLEEYPSGSVILVRSKRHHFQEALSGDYVVQIEGDGPTAVEYARPSDDPRNAVSPA